jgi:hypothetical protein
MAVDDFGENFSHVGLRIDAIELAKFMPPAELCRTGHHEGYIGWAEYERNQKQLALNNYGRAGGVKSGRGGRALLSGIMTCGRCGRRLSVGYTGNP